MDSTQKDFSPEIELLMAQAEDTTQPSFDIMNLKIAIRELIQDVEDHEKAKGITEKSKESKAKFNQMLDICERLDKVASQNNTFQLIVKHSLIELENIKGECKRLNDIISANEKAWNND